MPAMPTMHCNDDPPLKLVFFFPLHCFSDRKHHFPASWLRQARPSKLPPRRLYSAPDSDLIAQRREGRRECCVSGGDRSNNKRRLFTFVFTLLLG